MCISLARVARSPHSRAGLHVLYNTLTCTSEFAMYVGLIFKIIIETVIQITAKF